MDLKKMKDDIDAACNAIANNIVSLVELAERQEAELVAERARNTDAQDFATDKAAQIAKHGSQAIAWRQVCTALDVALPGWLKQNDDRTAVQSAVDAIKQLAAERACPAAAPDTASPAQGDAGEWRAPVGRCITPNQEPLPRAQQISNGDHAPTGDEPLSAAVLGVVKEWERQKGLFNVLSQDSWMDLAVAKLRATYTQHAADERLEFEAHYYHLELTRGSGARYESGRVADMWDAWKTASGKRGERPSAAAVEARAPTDISARLREQADESCMLVRHSAAMRAGADEIERYYNGMMAWKQTAETKDAKLSEEIAARTNDRIKTAGALDRHELAEAHDLLTKYCVADLHQGERASLAERVAELYSWYEPFAQGDSRPVDTGTLRNWLAMVHDNERTIGDRLQSLSSRISSLLRGDAPDKYPPFTIREPASTLSLIDHANVLIAHAEAFDMVVRIETEPRLPLAMGNYKMVASVQQRREPAMPYDQLNQPRKNSVPPAGWPVALHAAVSAIHFDDRNDYLAALWTVVKELAPDLVELLEKNPSAAWHQTEIVGSPAGSE